MEKAAEENLYSDFLICGINTRAKMKHEFLFFVGLSDKMKPKLVGLSDNMPENRPKLVGLSDKFEPF